MPIVNWTAEGNEQIFADYFAILADDIDGREHKKAEDRRLLLSC
jgi:hypothetical protein